MKRLLLTIVSCAVLLASCGSDDESTTGTSGGEDGASTAPMSKPKVTVPDGPPPKQLEITDLEEGTGAEVQEGDKVTVHYVGVGYDSGKEFDASWNRGEPFPFTVGGSEVIDGWEQGVKGMKPGGRRELIVPPELAYGKTGFPPAIGPNETLVFVIDLFEVGQ